MMISCVRRLGARLHGMNGALHLDGLAETRPMIDAAGYRYHTGHGGVVTPNDPLETIEEVARGTA